MRARSWLGPCCAAPRATGAGDEPGAAGRVGGSRLPGAAAGRAAEPTDAEAVAGAPAVRLFLDRGSAARGGGPAGARDAPVKAAGRICRDAGRPAASDRARRRAGEHAVGRRRSRRHLEDRFRFLAYRRPAADPRHRR